MYVSSLIWQAGRKLCGRVMKRLSIKIKLEEKLLEDIDAEEQ